MVERDDGRTEEEAAREDNQNALRRYRAVTPSRLQRKLVNTALKALAYSHVIVGQLYDEKLKKYLRDPELRGILFGGDEYRTGLLESSIFENTLTFPNKENTSLESQKARAGRYVAYDHFRPDEFGMKVLEQRRNVKTGRIYAFPLDEVINNNPDTYTPTGLLRVFDYDHMLQVQTPTISELIDYGLVKETTYQEAYKNVGLYEKHKRLLTLKDLQDKPIYTITPKGNGLVFLEPDSGDTEKFDEKSPSPVFTRDGLSSI